MMLDVLKLRKGGLSCAFGGALLLTAFASGVAQAGDRVGVLQCRLSGSPLEVLVENQDVDCVYQDDDEGFLPAHYVGKLTKVGAGITINGPGEVVWVVAAATGHLGPGALAGDYAGPGTTVSLASAAAARSWSAAATTPYRCSPSRLRPDLVLASRQASII